MKKKIEHCCSENKRIYKLEREVNDLKKIEDRSYEYKLSIFKENLFTDLQEKYDQLQKKANDKRVEILKKEKDADDVDIIQCDKCEFMARSDAGLKVHNRAKHTEQTQINC